VTQNYEFALVVEGFDLDNLDDLDSLYTTFDDVGATDQLGRTTIEFVVESVSAGSALRDTLYRFRAKFPRASVLRLDRDLVNISEIADRIDRTPESVRLLANGARGSGEFPAPVGVLPGGTRIWEWSAVFIWLERNDYISDLNHPIDFWTATEFDYYLFDINGQFRHGEIRVVTPMTSGIRHNSGHWSELRSTIEARYRTQVDATSRELSVMMYTKSRS
jgi:hypothetical protein